MKSMSQFYAKKYILPPIIRKAYKVGGLFALIGLLVFAIFMLGVGIRQDADKVPCFSVAGIFGALFIGCLIIWSRNYLLIDATYQADHSVVMNCVDKQGIKVSVDLCSALPIEYTHPFYIGKGGFFVEYMIFSPNTLLDSAVSEFEGKSIYKVLRKIWTSGSVIIPKRGQGDGSIVPGTKDDSD